MLLIYLAYLPVSFTSWTDANGFSTSNTSEQMFRLNSKSSAVHANFSTYGGARAMKSYSPVVRNIASNFCTRIICPRFFKFELSYISYLTE